MLDVEKREEIVYKADPFAFVFRELDLIHSDVREIKAELGDVGKRIDEVNRRINGRIDDLSKRIDGRIDDTNRRIDSSTADLNKRLDRLYLIVILNLIGIVIFLIKTFLFSHQDRILVKRCMRIV